jgi:glycosidase
MPDLNLLEPAVRGELKWIAKLWLDRGADGFRLDAVRHLVETGPGPGGQDDTEETHAFLREFAAYVRSIRPDAILVGEAWTEDSARFVRYFGDTARVPHGDELPMLFDFALSSALLEGLKTGSAAPIAARLDEIGRAYPPGAIGAPFLTNHDQIRVATQLKGDPARLRLAAALLLTLPGAPFLYYGEEIGLRQPNNGDDEFKRTPMHWTAAPGAGFTTGKPWQRVLKDYEAVNVERQSGDPASLLSRYRTLIRLRKASPSLRAGALERLPAEGGVLAFLRRSAGETTLVVHNLGTTAATAGPLALPAGAPAALLADPGVTLAKGPTGWTATLAPGSTGVWRLGKR